MPFGWGAADSFRSEKFTERKTDESPMPFGWGAADSDHLRAELVTEVESPMPFGWGAADSNPAGRKSL